MASLKALAMNDAIDSITPMPNAAAAAAGKLTSPPKIAATKPLSPMMKPEL